MPITQEQYFKKPEENVEQYTARIAGLRNAPSAITGDVLTPAGSTDYVNPNPVYPTMPTTPTATTATQPGKTEKSVSDLIAEVEGMQTGLGGEKATYQQQLLGEQGIADLKKAEADYTYQFKQLEAEYKNLQIESQKVPYQVEGEFTGRASVSQQEGKTRARQRNITLKSLDISSKANTVSALLLGQQGLISAANERIIEAVNQKFAVREADIKAKIDNLNLKLKDPNLSIEEKNRANAQLEIQNKKDEETATKKTNSAAILKMATDAAANGATPLQAQAIAAIAQSENPDIQAAFALYAPFGAKQEKSVTTTDLTEFKAFFPNVDISTPVGQQQFLDWKARTTAAVTKAPAAETRDTEVSQFLQSKKGTDGFVSASIYQTALQKFIAGGGNQTNFIASFPQQTYLRQEEMDKLPVALQIKTPSRMTASTIDPTALAELNDDITKGVTLSELYNAYPEISPALIQSLFYNR